MLSVQRGNRAGHSQARCREIISDMVVKGADVTEEEAEKIYQRELKKISRKFTHMRYHSFLMYFGVLKTLEWVEKTGKLKTSAFRTTIHDAPSRMYYRLTQEGKICRG